jgi:DNA-binding response OmpR family regulator
MSGQSPVALVIDDEIQIRRFLRAGFELENFVVREAATAADGIRAATLKLIDLVILDLGLPDMDGAARKANRYNGSAGFKSAANAKQLRNGAPV